MIICGIDPGLSGAIARLDAKTGALIDVVDMPILVLKKARKTSRIVDAYSLVGLFGRDRCGHVFIETQQTRPGQPPPTVAKTFGNFGLILGVIAALGIPVSQINARTWKAGLRVPASKDAARARASELFGSAVHWPLARHDGRAEAALIGLWGLRTLLATAA